jgi:hypothetical protein
MLFAILLSQATPSAALPVDLSYKSGVFTAKGLNWTETVAIAPKETPQLKKFDFVDGDFRIFWDGKQMTVRLGKYQRSTKFVDIPTSPRLFSKEQIMDTIRSVDTGEMSLEASALAGHELIGEEMYLLLRWNREDKKPGFEALVRINMSEKTPWFKVMGKLPGTSKATGVVSDELFLENKRLATVAEQGEGKWGLATWDLDESYMRYFPLGKNLFRYSIPGKAPEKLMFVERSSYGTYLGGEIELATKERVDLAESRDKISFISSDPVVVRFDSPEQCRIRFINSSLERTFAPWTAARMTKQGLLTWIPSSTPTQAAFFYPDNWTLQGKWFANP